MNNIHRHQILERLGIEQLPALLPGEEIPFFEPEETRAEIPIISLPVSTLQCFGIRSEATTDNYLQVPGRKCPACLAKGETVWVIPGKCCPQCGTPVN